ncbi:MAG TPA: UDP-N-acetylmuramate--L-alanine ligase [Solirubrobacteraceae bacterium]|nr:UDP-N-acetylmuramate--L-alanine ligase [Solirubrobacteraceae bacterium]
MSAQPPWAGRALHFVGLGGAGMSGLALVAHALGARVTGSDRGDSAYLDRVRAAGIEPVLGHDAAHLPPGDDVEVVISTAIPPDNPERAAARERGLREVHRGELLAQVGALKRCIAVAGTHGKTTTASMAAHALLRCDMDPAYLIGGELRSTGVNAAWGEGEWVVVEADESDRSFLRLRPELGVVTNVELDHHATYASRVEVEEAFADFLRGTHGAILWDAPDAEALLDRAGVPDAAFFRADDVELGPGGSTFTWAGQRVGLAVPGAHNVANAAAALTACVLAGAPAERLAGALEDFRGARRRFERLGSTASGAEVVDDYAHHPTEVAATLAAARTLSPRRLVAVFQPHLYSRTERLHREFGAALGAADVIAVLDVYPARERAEDHPGVSGRLVAAAAADAAPGRTVLWLPGLDTAEGVLAPRLREGDLCLVLGAGDVDRLGRALVGREAL